MQFLKEPVPERGVATPVCPGISRIVANNPGRMTCHGTNTYLIEAKGGFIVVDPGPQDTTHIADILRATKGRIAKILLTHAHHDHFDNLAALRAASGARSYGYHLPTSTEFTPDLGLQDGDLVDGWQALWTPGHAADHLCFARADGVVLTGDVVMAWSTSVVGPPGGNMAAYVGTLHRLLSRTDTLFLPGHGPALPAPHAYLEDLLAHRLEREADILAAVHAGATGTFEIVAAVYKGLDPALSGAAQRSVRAHLDKLCLDGQLRQAGDRWQAA
jgi:glyoxylase-like metal-dependent hydrolase (beta-lactamase superfamily II)